MSKYTEILTHYPDLKSVLFCGNHGDPMMNPYISDLCQDTSISYTIATNGSIGLLETYKRLAKLNVTIVFGIDGLENTNHLYRQGVIWSNLMDRVKCFIEAGGKAEWQFIKFQHNMDQINDAKNFSAELGFKNFFIVEDNRNNFPAIQKDKSISHWILPPDKNAKPTEFDVEDYLKMRYDPMILDKPKCKVSKIHCEHLTGSVYVNSLGELFPCCFHGFGHVDRPKVYLEDFGKLQQTWNTDQCDETCAGSCGAP